MGGTAAGWRMAVEAYLPDGRLKAAWEGVPLVRRGPVRVLAARWQRPPGRVGELPFEPGDTLLEWYRADAWFNAFRVVAPDGRLRGWYVNLVRPGTTLGAPDDERWSYTDLGLDFVVTPAGCQVLDEGDWRQALAALPPGDARRARAEAERLRQLLSAPGPALAFLDRLQREPLGPGEEHLLDLAARWGPPDAVAFARVAMDEREPGGAWGWWRMQRDGRRVAEAIAVLVRGDRVLLHRKAGYPGDTVRLPGGGVPAGEPPDAAAVRELREETGLEARVSRWLAFVRWEIALPGGARFPMPNYVFLLADDSGREPVPSAEERIVELPWLPVAELQEVAGRLRRLTGPWGAWGIYRALAHDLAHRALAGTRG